MSEWTDVTAECAAVPDSTAGEWAMQYQGQDVFHGYRLRKVRMSENPFNEVADAEAGDTRVAFIVERWSAR